MSNMKLFIKTKIFKSNQKKKSKPQNTSFVEISGTFHGRSLLEIILTLRKLILILNLINFIRNLKVDGCSSKENLFGQSTLLMNAMYTFFP